MLTFWVLDGVVEYVSMFRCMCVQEEVFRESFRVLCMGTSKGWLVAGKVGACIEVKFAECHKLRPIDV